MIDVSELGKKLDELAAKMMEDAQKDGVPLPQRLDVFKTCSQHYVNVQKVRGKDAPPAGNMTMGGLRDRVANGQTAEQGDEEDESTSAD